MIKVLIIEDEAGIRESLSNAYHWTELGCELIGAVDSGLAALEVCLHTQPDIIISDIVMPGIDGLTLLKYLKEKNSSIKYIILTGHREFDYAKDAVNLGAEFYMLKPINYNELLVALTSLIDQIMNESEEKKTETLQVQILRNLLLGKLYQKTEMSQKAQAFLNKIRGFRVAIIKFDEENNVPFKIENLLLYCENTRLFSEGIILKIDNYHLALFLPCQADDSPDTFYQSLLLSKNNIAKFFQSTISIGISNILYGSDSLHEAYIQAVSAFERKFFSGNDSINMFFSENFPDAQEALVDFNALFSFPNIAKDNLIRYQDEQLVLCMKKLFQDFVNTCKNNKDFVISSFFIMVTLLIRNVLGEQGKKIHLFYEKYSNFQKIISCGLLSDLEVLFLDITMDLKHYIDSKTNSHQDTIAKVEEYIQLHYSENITLNDIAKEVYLSPAYLSSLITSETGKSFIDMLNEKRISSAIKLLADKNIRISEIACSVGFNEPQYFTLTFKKYTGHTPRNYRDLFLQKIN